MYDSFNLQKDMRGLSGLGARVFNIGTTQFGMAIQAAIVGDGLPNSLILGATHAREHITAKLVADLAKNHKGRAILYVPMLNPDGVNLAIGGLETVPKELRARLLKLNKKSHDFSLWKANLNGVDINVNFNAAWGSGRENVTRPSPQNYIGAYPESEAETKAIVAAVKRFNITAAVSYHCKGEVVYYGFKNGNANFKAARRLALSTGYTPLKTPYSAGGFKDWLIASGGVGFTIEVGRDSLSYDQLYDTYDVIYQQNQKIPSLLQEIADEYQIYVPSD